MTAGVYAIVNTITGHRYIGITKDFRVRSRSHRSGLNTGHLFNKALREAWLAHGAGAFQIEMIEETAPDDDTLEAAERRWIEHFAEIDRALLYNWHLAGKRNTRPSQPCACHRHPAPTAPAGGERTEEGE